MKAVFDDSIKNNEPLIKQIQSDLNAIEEKVKAVASDADLTALLDNLHTDNQKLMSARKNELEQIKAILTPTQQAKEIRPDETLE